MSNLKDEIPVSVSAEGLVSRAEDGKLLADVSKGSIDYKNPAYAKGRYKEAIEAAAAKFEAGDTEEAKEDPPLVDEPIPVENLGAPDRDPIHGYFSHEWVNYDVRTLSDKEFAHKYSHCAENMLDWILHRPDLFTDIETSDNRFGKLLEK